MINHSEVGQAHDLRDKLTGLLRLDQELHRPWTEEQWSGADLGAMRLFLCWQQQSLVGFSLYLLSPHEQLAHLLKLCLDPSLRGTGVALEHFLYGVSHLKNVGMRRIYLEVAVGNVRAQRFYIKAGFVALREVKGFYSNGEAALTMELAI